MSEDSYREHKSAEKYGKIRRTQIKHNGYGPSDAYKDGCAYSR